MRRDLADIRLADRVFAPHYASAVQRQVVTPADLRVGPDAGSEVLAQLAVGEVVEVLEFVKGRAWGLAPAHELVGYLDADALSWPKP